MTESLEHTSNIEEVSIPCDIARLDELGVLGTLLQDNSTDGNIVWGTSAYEGLGKGYQATDEMTVESITGNHIELIRRRARKNKDERSNLTRAHAEVFTPTWICKMMIDHADEAWLEDQIRETSWKEIAQSTRLEITCGEAPYLFGRYDAADGGPIAFKDRIGIFDRKLQLISSNTSRRQDFMRWAIKALQSTYGYEFQGDNLLIARINAFTTIENALSFAAYKPLDKSEAEDIAAIISWNLWQMDGLTKCVPFGSFKEENPQMDLFGGLFNDPPSKQEALFPERGLAKIRNWGTSETVEYDSVTREGKNMKFDYIIGNPPYQEETEGNGRDNPIYNHFMEGAYELSDVVELITPARFLFNAGQTPKAWNRKMLDDEHLKVILYEPDGTAIFPNTDIKGGVAVTLRNARKNYGAIGIFTSYPELNAILEKVNEREHSSLSDVVTGGVPYSYTSALSEEHPEFVELTGKSFDVRTNALDNLSGKIYFDEPQDAEEWVRIFGLLAGKRVEQWIKAKYLKGPDNFTSFKVFVPKSNGSGTLGEVLSSPQIGNPKVGHTQTFISIVISILKRKH